MPDRTEFRDFNALRDALLRTILLSGTVLAPFALIPLMFFVIREGHWAVAAADLSVYAVTVYLYFSRRPGRILRVGITLAITYFLGLIIIVDVGPVSGGAVWLFVFPILTAMFLGLRPAAAAVVLTTLTLGVIGALTAAGVIGSEQVFFVSAARALSAMASFVLLNAVVTAAVAVLIGQFEQMAVHDRHAAAVARREHASLAAAQQGLEQEIRRRKRVVEILKEGRRRYRSILEAVPNPIAISRISDGKYLQVNSALIAQSGFSKGEIMGRTTLDMGMYTEPAERDRMLAHLERHGEIRDFQTRFRIKDGSMRDVLMFGRPLCYGKEACLVTVVLDITERHRMEMALVEEEKRFRELTELLPGAVFETDASGSITFANQNAMNIFGYEKECSFNTVKIQDLVAPEDRQNAVDNFAKTLAGQCTALSEYRALRKDGTQFPVMAHTSPIRSGSKVSGVRGFAVDISEKKRLEAHLQQAQKMEAIGTLAGGIAHDFNNILAAILGYTELCLMTPDIDVVLSGHLEKIQQAGGRATDLVRQILSFSRRDEKLIQPLRLAPIVTEVVNLLRATLPSTIEIRLEIGSDPLVRADPTWIHQVLMNLGTNAAHAMRETGGVLQVHLDQAEQPLGEAARQGAPLTFQRLMVADNGCGMAPELVGRIFDPFFTTKTREQGTGMGLSVVHGIVKGLGGRIQVNSRPGKGTAFHVDLPICSEPMESCQGANQDLPMGNEWILFVDDEPAQVEIGCELLSRLGYHVVGVRDSLEALNRFRGNPADYDLVVSDVTMPGLTGDELTREILSICPQMPVILCTGFSDRVDEARALAVGARRMVLKPLGMLNLARTVRQVLDENLAG